jgi:NitT/TauT family transport system substrate-binding protein
MASALIIGMLIPPFDKEVGIEVVEDPIESSSAALTALQTGQVDVTSNQGTNNPLQFIAEGSDFTIVGGYMLKGMYLVAKAGTGFNSVEDFVGKKIAYAGVHPVVGMAMLDAGLDPLDESVVEWLSYSTNSDRLAAVTAGEADYAVLSGDQLFAVGNNEDLEITCWLDDLVPNYGCCRMNMRTEFVEENPVTVKLMLKALIRAEQWYLANTEECVSILAEDIGADEDYVAAYLLNENYVSSVDPCKNSVVKTWDGMVKMGFIDEDVASGINVEDHINTDIYEAALNECVDEYYDEDPDFYDGRLSFFEENDK